MNVEEIHIENVSGLGGNLTYHVSRMLENKVVAEVALHLVGEKGNFKNSPYQLQIQKSATEAFASAGLSPKRLLDIEDKLFINEWIKGAEKISGTSFPPVPDDNNVSVDLVQKLGKLLAKIHTVKSDWYEPHYQKLLQDYPGLADVPRGSSFWYLTMRNYYLFFGADRNRSMDKWMKRLIDGYRTYL